VRTLVLCLLLVGLAGPAAAAPQRTIAVVADGPWFVSAEVLGLVQSEIEAVAGGEFEILFPARHRYVGDWTEASVRRGLDSAMAAPDVDLVLAMGLLATHLAGLRPRLPKPVVGPVVIDPEVQGLPYVAKRGVSGRRNFTYVTNPETIASDLSTLRDLTGARRVAYLVTAGFRDTIPSLKPNAIRIAQEAGLELTVVEVGDRAPAALASLPPDTQAVYVAALLRMSPSEELKLIEGLKARGLPSFSQAGRGGVEAGYYAAIASGYDVPRRARRVALDVQRIFLGEPASELPVLVSRTERLVLNIRTARAIGVWPSFDNLADAQLVDQERTEVDRSFTLSRAAEVAVDRNLAYEANRFEVDSGDKDVFRARSSLYPQASAGLSGTIIDEDRTSPIANQAERQIQGSLAVSQVLYAEPVYANLQVQEFLQSSREYLRDSLRLDTLLAATVAYLDVLRASTLEQIQRDNLRVTRSNRELAVVRRKVGVAGPSEVYRWDSQLATDKAAVIEAIASRNATEIELNRVLNDPLEAPMQLEESSYDDPMRMVPGSLWRKSLDNPWEFKVFRNFMVEVGLAASPELKAVDAQVEAADRQRRAATRAWWLPQFSVQAQVAHILAQDGEGSDLDPDAEDQIGQLGIPIPDDTSWSASILLDYPLFTGLARLADVQQAELDVSQLRTERDELAQRVEQRIRTTLHFAGSGYANIRLSRQAATAADKNLEVVRDAYARGSLGYLNLLDAQNQALVARQVASNAVYDFLIDLMNVQRAANRFVMLEDPGEQDEFGRRLKSFFRAEGYELESPDSESTP
jgi:outer membrane protein TolC